MITFSTMDQAWKAINTLTADIAQEHLQAAKDLRDMAARLGERASSLDSTRGTVSLNEV